MATPDPQFVRRLLATFRIEAEEHLGAISNTLLELEKSPSGVSATMVENVYREAHSLKGAARAVDLTDIETICHRIESVFAIWKQEQNAPSAEALDGIHRALDEIHALLAEEQSEASVSQPAAGPSGTQSAAPIV